MSVFVGRKPIKNYVLACITAFNTEEVITVAARGNAISRAVDVVEFLNRQFIPLKVESIEIGTVRIEEMGETPRNISEIEIKVRKA